MGDASCGPSNPLQNLRKQTNTDRSLQQDRLAARNPQGQQGFRTAAPNAGQLDSEFEAFAAGSSPAGVPFHGPPPAGIFHQPAPGLQHESQAGMAAAGGWAGDFLRQNMGAANQAATPYTPVSNNPAPAAASWHLDFLAQQGGQNTVGIAPQQQQSPFASGYQASMYQQSAPVSYPMNYNPGFQTENYDTSSRWKGKGRWQEPQHVETQEMTDAFEREFEERMKLMSADDAAATESLRQGAEMGYDTNIYEPESLDQSNAQQLTSGEAASQIEMEQEAQRKEVLRENPSQQERSLNDQERDYAFVRDMAIDESKPSDPTLQQDRDPLLMATAREVTEKMNASENDKFKNSQFLGLMRRIGAGEAYVENHELLDPNAPEEATATTTIPSSEQDTDTHRNDTTMTGAMPSSINTTSNPNRPDTGNSRSSSPSPSSFDPISFDQPFNI